MHIRIVSHTQGNRKLFFTWKIFGDNVYNSTRKIRGQIGPCRFDDQDIGELPLEWNWLASEYKVNREAKLIHYTLGTPCFKDYKNSDMADIWYHYYDLSQKGFDQ